MNEKITSFFPQSRSSKKDKSLPKEPLLIKKVFANSNDVPTIPAKEALVQDNIENIQPLKVLKQSKSVSPVITVEEAVPLYSKKRKWEISHDIHTNHSIKSVGHISNTKLVNGFIGKKRVELPVQYQRLEKMFSALESTITFMKSRDQAIVFHRIQRAVQGMCNSNFELKHLGQMIHLVPGLYILEPIKIIHLGVKKDSLVFITDSKVDQQSDEASKVVFGGTQTNIPTFEKNENVIRQAELLTHTLYERKKTFHDALVRDFLYFYNNYLVSVAKPEVDMLPFIWHNGFDEKSLPEIVSAELPISAGHAQLKEEIPKTVFKDVDQSKLCISKGEEIGASQSSILSDKPKSKAAQLLERIKEKERQKKERIVPIQNAAVLREKCMLQRLPEMIQSIKLLYAKENRTMLLMFKVCNHLSNSMIKNPISKDEALSHIKLLCSIAPDFISMLKTDSGTSLRMTNKKYEEIEKYLKEYGKKLC